MSNPKVSVIVPCYGVERYLNRCMQSLLNQTLNDIEIILIDDGSKDGVPSMCDEYAQKDNRVKVIHKQNEGLGFARNTGLDAAAGDYIAFVDSDDFVDVDMFNGMYMEAISSDADIVLCGIQKETAKDKWIKRIEVQEKTVWEEDAITDYMLDMVACAPYVKRERKYQMSVWHCLYRHELIEKNDIRFYSEREVVSEDIPFQVSVLKKARKIVYLPDYYYQYCLNETSLTATFRPEKFLRFKTLYSVLSSLLADVDGGQLRVQRLFIGYARRQVMAIANIGHNRKRMLEELVNDSIWQELRNTYRPSFLPMFAGVVYYLTYTKQTVLLLVLCRILKRKTR